MGFAELPREISKALTAKADQIWEVIKDEEPTIQHSLLTNVLLDLMVKRDIPLSEFIEALEFGYDLKQKHQQKMVATEIAKIYKTRH